MPFLRVGAVGAREPRLVVSLRFLGTGGARWVVAKQIRSSGGFWLQADGTNIHVDPGPGALVRALTQLPVCDLATLDAIVVSHKHLDHSGDVNAMIEAMCQGGWRPRGALCAPRDALDASMEPVVFPYARRFVPREWIVEAHAGPFAVGNVELRASLRLQHPVEAYGLLMEVLGTGASVRAGSPGEVLAGRIERAHRAALILTFGGGTNEVQRDIIAAAGLGLPFSRR